LGSILTIMIDPVSDVVNSAMTSRLLLIRVSSID
jgi:hypothetical protein